MKIYIAGPMRGIADWNFPTFDQAETVWKSAGHHPLSPAQTCRALGYALGEHGDPNDPVGKEHLKHVMLSDIACLYAADAIALLPGWESSSGATVELAIAQFLGLEIYDAITMEPIDPDRKPWQELREFLVVKQRANNGNWDQVWRDTAARQRERENHASPF